MLCIGEQVGRPTGDGRVRDSTSRSTRSRARTWSPPARRTRSPCSPRPSGAACSTPRTPTSRSCASGPVAAGHVDITASARRRTCARIAESLRRDVRDITIVILDRPRHESLIEEVRSTGARIKLISDGDLSAAISCAVSGTGVHGVMGIGGAPEGVITAAALRCLGGEIQARFRFRNDEERERAERMLGHADESHVSTAPRTWRLGRAPRVRGDRRDRGRPARGRPVLRRRRAHPLAGDGLPDQAGALRGHGPHVRPRPSRPPSGSRRRGSRARWQGDACRNPTSRSAGLVPWSARSERQGSTPARRDGGHSPLANTCADADDARGRGRL